jgi:hypothetical protein
MLNSGQPLNRLLQEIADSDSRLIGGTAPINIWSLLVGLSKNEHLFSKNGGDLGISDERVRDLLGVVYLIRQDTEARPKVEVIRQLTQTLLRLEEGKINLLSSKRLADILNGSHHANIAIYEVPFMRQILLELGRILGQSEHPQRKTAAFQGFWCFLRNIRSTAVPKKYRIWRFVSSKTTVKIPTKIASFPKMFFVDSSCWRVRFRSGQRERISPISSIKPLSTLVVSTEQNISVF